jgi:SnoaL-like domain
MTDLLIAEVEVRRLIFTYARAVDRLDRDLLATIFLPDAQVELGTIYQGCFAGFLDVAMGFMGSMAATRHDVGNILVTVEADGRVSAESYVQAWHRIKAPSETRELIVYGRYLTRIECRDGHWGIAWHSEIIDWGRDVAADSAWFDGNAEMPKGRRDRDDLSYRVIS